MGTGRTVVQVEVDAALAELAADALWQAGPSAVLEVDLPDGRVRLTADVPDPDLVGDRWDPTRLPIDDDRYLDAWRTWAVPVRAGRRLVVHPAWVPRAGTEPVDDLVLVIDPGRSFGSGSHESTRLALALLEATVAPGDRVLDVGCGSGVLAVAAARLGAGHVTAIDLEPDAAVATRANAVANEVAGRVAASTTDLRDVDAGYDVVVANIGGGVLPGIAPRLEAAVAPGGSLLVSGVLVDQLDALVAACPRCAVEARVDEAGWAAARLRRLTPR